MTPVTVWFEAQHPVLLPALMGGLFVSLGFVIVPQARTRRYHSPSHIGFLWGPPPWPWDRRGSSLPSRKDAVLGCTADLWGSHSQSLGEQGGFFQQRGQGPAAQDTWG